MRVSVSRKTNSLSSRGVGMIASDAVFTNVYGLYTFG